MKRKTEYYDDWGVQCNPMNGRFYVNLYLDGKKKNVIGSTVTPSGCDGLRLRYIKRPYVVWIDKETGDKYKWDKESKTFIVISDEQLVRHESDRGL